LAGCMCCYLSQRSIIFSDCKCRFCGVFRNKPGEQSVPGRAMATHALRPRPSCRRWLRRRGGRMLSRLASRGPAGTKQCRYRSAAHLWRAGAPAR
jgi:hypothetical protein